MDSLLKNIGNKIRAERKKRGYSQDELADRAGLHTTYIGGIERGEKNATVTSLNKIADALNMPLFKLLRLDTDDPDAEDVVVIEEITELYRGKSEKTKKMIRRIIEVIVEEFDQLNKLG